MSCSTSSHLSLHQKSSIFLYTTTLVPRCYEGMQSGFVSSFPANICTVLSHATNYTLPYLLLKHVLVVCRLDIKTFSRANPF